MWTSLGAIILPATCPFSQMGLLKIVTFPAHPTCGLSCIPGPLSSAPPESLGSTSALSFEGSPFTPFPASLVPTFSAPLCVPSTRGPITSEPDSTKLERGQGNGSGCWPGSAGEGGWLSRWDRELAAAGPGVWEGLGNWSPSSRVLKSFLCLDDKC